MTTGRAELKIELARELAFETQLPGWDPSIRAGSDSLHPLRRSGCVTSFASWDLLELVGHRELKLAAIRAIEEGGTGVSCARMLGGSGLAVSACESRVASFFTAESALLFSSRNQAILTTITALCSEGVVVLGSAFSPLPLADACALMGAEFFEFDDDEELRSALERCRSARRVLVVCESVCGISGKKRDITAFFAAVESSGAWAIVDETAALGCSGLRGAGSAEEVPVSPALLCRLVGFASIGGGELSAIVGSNDFRAILSNRSRYLRFEFAPSPVSAAVVPPALDAIEVALTYRERLALRSSVVDAALRAQGWSLASSGGGPIVALWFGTMSAAREVQEALLARGIVVEAIPAQATRRTGAVVRVLLTTGHTEAEIEKLLESLLEIRKRGLCSVG